MTLPTLVSFWHGPMSWLEALCIASFVRQGHRVEIFAFDRPDNFPHGAVWRDASEILPRADLVFYKGKGTPAVFSDRFRLELMRQAQGVYVDLDLYLVAPIVGPQDYLMAWEKPGSVNSAVLHIPADAPLLGDLLSIFSDQNRPLLEPFLTPMRRWEVAARRLLGERIPPENLQYGATGPMALTHYVRARGLADRVLPSSSFYPIPYERIPPLMQPGSSVDPFVRADTTGIHLWRSQFTARGRAGMPVPPVGSAMADLCRREGIVPN
ncbi:hypothetical protein SAMN05216456_3651 [Devosia crocina]|uniref:Glycosyltransferase sugar-binding region containing DXD motif-containing protein n=1 Tax=Devosia crocina TaxID=429728 RepID=A0A1I7NW00_9HYPH|nr:hypothetical protein [Devosia crocina]SFV38850.1 hypothetical protein SAMN05216456_3651 [Devosia crocina]